VNHALTSREIAHAFGISKRAANYHLKKLLKMGLIMRIGSQNSPATIYMLSKDVYDAAQGADVRGRVGQVYRILREMGPMRPGQLLKYIPVSRRQLSRYLKTLFGRRLIIRAGGWKCPYNYIIALPRPQDEIPEHRHIKTRKHKYKLGGRIITRKY